MNVVYDSKTGGKSLLGTKNIASQLCPEGAYNLAN